MTDDAIVETLLALAAYGAAFKSGAGATEKAKQPDRRRSGVVSRRIGAK